jgi:parallel beta-helix repeat protein
VEAWSPGNTYIRNRANWSSYGFWLGGSDDTVVIDNEAMHNGKALRNAPEPFGNAGISVVHGSSSGFLLSGNRIEDNAGPGLSIAFKPDAPARGWLIAGNRITNNRNDARGYAGHGGDRHARAVRPAAGEQDCRVRQRYSMAAIRSERGRSWR